MFLIFRFFSNGKIKHGNTVLIKLRYTNSGINSNMWRTAQEESVSHISKQFLDTRWAAYNSTQFLHSIPTLSLGRYQIPQVKRSVL